MFLCSTEHRFSIPTWIAKGAAHSRRQDWPKATAEGGAARS